MKYVFEHFLRFLTILIIKKYKPKIIGVTGSVGKTSTKEAIYTVLSSKFRVRRNMKNYNNEIGVPLTFIGIESPGRSFFGWMRVFLQALQLVVRRDSHYPEILIIEMGADHKGDIQYLVKFVPCFVGVITSISESHLEFFGSVEEIAHEKANIIRFLPQAGYAVLNVDEKNVNKVRGETEAHVMGYGFSDEAQIRASDVIMSGQSFDARMDIAQMKGVSFKMHFQGSSVPVMIPKVLGKQHIFAALAASALGVIFEMNLIEISESLKKYQPPHGRMNLLSGIKHTLLLDDTYNASLISTKAALDVGANIQLSQGRSKFAVLGDMLELGAFSETAHQEVGKYAAKLKFDILVTVGERSYDMAQSAEAAGMNKEHIFSFSTAEEAGRFLQERIESGDLILVKGSQGMRMEKIIKELMAEPLRAKELLVRQDEHWLK